MKYHLGVEHLMHVFAVLAVLFGLVDGFLSYAETVMQQIVIVLLTIKYFVLAIFFEVVALNCREINDKKNDKE